MKKPLCRCGLFGPASTAHLRKENVVKTGIEALKMGLIGQLTWWFIVRPVGPKWGVFSDILFWGSAVIIVAAATTVIVASKGAKGAKESKDAA